MLRRDAGKGRRDADRLAVRLQEHQLLRSETSVRLEDIRNRNPGPLRNILGFRSTAGLGEMAIDRELYRKVSVHRLPQESSGAAHACRGENLSYVFIREELGGREYAAIHTGERLLRLAIARHGRE